MKKIMNSPSIKTIVVRLTADNVSEFDVDTDIFDDPYLEAATRAVEKIKKQKHGILRAITECWEKKSSKKSQTIYMYNSYWILVNASCFYKAEQLRDKFKMQTGCDLFLEPMHGNNTK